MRLILDTERISILTSLHSATSVTKALARLDIPRITADLLGHTYQLEILVCGPHLARQLNLQYRRKDYIPDILSFPLDDQHGQIVLCPSAARSSAKKFPQYQSEAQFLLFLLVHGLLHLKGSRHGTMMGDDEAHYHNRYRHWHL